MKRSMFKILCFLWAINFLKAQGIAESGNYTLPRTKTSILHSDINRVTYELYISYPKSYNDSIQKKYPVLYLLDADYSFAIAKNIADHLSERGHLQELVIIGIAYPKKNEYRINRTRDYTPLKSSENVWFREIQIKYSGGGPEFLGFIEKELIPYIQKTVRTTGFRAIVGHSYGGLFATWTMLTKPELFNGYIVVSPSLWYADHKIFELTGNLKNIDERKKVYFAVGEREVNDQWNMPRDLKRLVDDLRSRDLKFLEIDFSLREDETHNSVFPGALSNGLRFVFDGV